MLVTDAQYEFRIAYFGGSVGICTGAFVWALSAAVATWWTMKAGMLVLLIGGAFIFPISELILRAMGSKGPSRENPLRELAVEVAVVGPLMLPLVGAAALYRANWFYPALAIAMGAHYLPFAFLYGMPHFTMLGMAMLAQGIMIGLFVPNTFVLAAWTSSAILLAFGIWIGRSFDQGSLLENDEDGSEASEASVPP